MKRFAVGVTAFLVFLASSPLSARAACYELEARLSIARQEWNEYQTYLGESDESSADLAKAEYANFTHDLDYIDEHLIDNCDDRNLATAYYLLEVKRQIKALDDDAQNQLYGSKDLLASDLWLLREAVASLYAKGYAKMDAYDYASLKRDVRSRYAAAGIPFEPWERAVDTGQKW